MASEREELTDLARRYLLETCPLVGAEALRIIDAHASDRAALVARAEAAEQALDRRNAECEDAEIRLREAQSDLNTWERTGKALECSENERIAALVAQVDGLNTALDTAEKRYVELVAQLAELTRARDEALAKAAKAQVLADSRFVEVTRLAQERDEARNNADCLSETLRDTQRMLQPGRLVPRYELDAALERGRDLEAERDRTVISLHESRQALSAAESEVTRLTEALAAAERRMKTQDDFILELQRTTAAAELQRDAYHGDFSHQVERAEAAEARVRELEAELARVKQ